MDDVLVKQMQAYSDCQHELQDLATNARDEARQLAETYMQQLQAAAGGDDYPERAASAWQEYQRGYMDLGAGFQEDYRQRVSAYMKTAGELQREAMRATITQAIEHLRSLEEQVAAAGDASDSGGSKKKSSKSS